MAGSEKTGPEAALPDLFAGRLVIVTPTRRTRPDTVRDAAAFWTALGADVIAMNPEAHDEALAEVSHLPHLVAAVIAQSTPKAHLPIAASGWRDTTRIAAGDAQLWTEILLDNRPNVLKSLARFEKTLAGVRAALERGDSRSPSAVASGSQTNPRCCGKLTFIRPRVSQTAPPGKLRLKRPIWAWRAIWR